MSGGSSNDGAAGLALLAVVVIFLLVAGLAHAIGADIAPTGSALLWSIGAAVPPGLFWFAIGRNSYNPPDWWLYVLIWAVLAWPGWWQVLNNIAANHGVARSLPDQILHSTRRDDYPMPYDEVDTWYTAAAFKWLVELAWIAAAGWAIKAWNDRR